MDEAHLLAALRYVALNPVRAGLTAPTIDWPRSSTRALAWGASDGMTAVAPVLERYPDFAALLAVGEDEEMSMRPRKTEQVGRPIGDDAFLARLEHASGRTLQRGRPGPKARPR